MKEKQNTTLDLVHHAVEEAVKREIDIVVETAKKQVEHNVRAAIGSIAATVMAHFTFERTGTELVIRCQFIDQPKATPRIVYQP